MLVCVATRGGGEHIIPVVPRWAQTANGGILVQQHYDRYRLPLRMNAWMFSKGVSWGRSQPVLRTKLG